MADTYDIIISAVDSASEAFQSIINTVQDFGSTVSDTVSKAGDDFDSMAENVSGFQEAVDNIDETTIEELADELGLSADEVERLIGIGAGLGSIPFDEAAAEADELEREIDETADAMERLGSAGDVKAAETLMSMSEAASGLMQSAANTAGSFQDSMSRVSLAAEGAGVSIDEMTSAVSTMSDETGRAGGKVREAFIAMTSAGITDVETMQNVFKGASAQAFILGIDVNSLADKFAGMAMKSTLSEKSLKGTGITMSELGEAMGMTGATADEVKEKWKELDTNQRAAALGMAASMNEGKEANDEYKNSWQGLQDQVEIAKGRLERLAGSVILPVLVPAMKIASDVLQGLGDTMDFIMKSPLGGLVSIIGTLAGVFVIAVTGAAGLRSILAFLSIQTMLDTTATIFNTAAKILNGEASGVGAIANALLGESFMASAAAAWTAAAGFLAAAWPLLVIVGVIALVVVAIYELGKAFGWWTDVSSMIDAISAGLQRLWNAFINHPDVQAAIQALSEAWDVLVEAVGNAWEAVTEFFGITDDGSFDIVRALIDGIGQAWNNIRDPVLAVINIIRTVLSVVWDVLNGNISVIDGIKAIWGSLVANMPVILNALFNVIKTIWQGILTTVSTIVRAVVNYVVNWFKQLPGKVLSALLGVVRSIVSAGQQWISNAKSKASSLVSNVVSVLSGLPGKISSALSGVVNAITKPFQDAYNAVSQKVDQIKNKINEVAGFSFGYDLGDAAGYDLGSTNDTLDINYNINLDLSGVPSGMSTEGLINALTDKTVLSALTGNRDFQTLDAKVKARIASKQMRARGV